MSLLIATATARASGLGAAGSRGMAARAANDALLLFLLLDDGFGDLGLRRCDNLSGKARLFFSFLARFFSRGLFCPAILFGAAALFFALLCAGALFATARFLERSKASFFRLTQKLGLHFLASGDFL